jgi:hypothetical protein
MWSTLVEAQQLGMSLLAGSGHSNESEEHIRYVLERINDITARLQT